MKLTIDIDDDLYTRLFDNGVDNYDDAIDIAKVIRKGTPLPKGRWTDIPMGYYMLLHQCSNCLRHSVIKSKYCPNCGVKMEIESENKQ